MVPSWLQSGSAGGLKTSNFLDGISSGSSRNTHNRETDASHRGRKGGQNDRQSSSNSILSSLFSRITKEQQDVSSFASLQGNKRTPLSSSIGSHPCPAPKPPPFTTDIFNSGEKVSSTPLSSRRPYPTPKPPPFTADISNNNEKASSTPPSSNIGSRPCSTRKPPVFNMGVFNSNECSLPSPRSDPRQSSTRDSLPKTTKHTPVTSVSKASGLAQINAPHTSSYSQSSESIFDTVNPLPARSTTSKRLLPLTPPEEVRAKNSVELIDLTDNSVPRYKSRERDDSIPENTDSARNFGGHTTRKTTAKVPKQQPASTKPLRTEIKNEEDGTLFSEAIPTDLKTVNDSDCWTVSSFDNLPSNTISDQEHRSTTSSPSSQLSILSQLKDHNYATFKMPSNVEEWKAGTGVKSKPVKLPSQSTRTQTLQEDINLFKRIESKHVKPPSETTLLVSKSERLQMREATKTSRTALEKRLDKRKRDRERRESRKKARLEDAQKDADNWRQEIKEQETVFAIPSKKDDSCPLPLPSGPKPPLPARKVYPPPPIARDRLVVQYTVFRTRRLPLDSWDGSLVGKIIRGETFLDKKRANKCAASQMPSPGPSVVRMEFDYGAQDEERDGMFFGRVHYCGSEIMLVYVDKEVQQFGKLDESEYADKPLRDDYRNLLLVPRYDVFVFLRKPLDGADGNYVVYEYDDETENEAIVEDIKEDEKEDDEDDSDEKNEVDNGDKTEELKEKDSTDNSTDNSKQEEKDIIEDTTDKPAEEPAEAPKEVPEKDDGINPVPATPPRTSPPAFHSASADSLGTHFVPIYEGSFTTLAAANARAVDAFAKWTRPSAPARLDALMYYRDVLRPYIAELRTQLVDDDDRPGAAETAQTAEITWVPGPQLRYNYEAINVVVVKSQLEGPLDMTGAF